jgi:RecA/RadA recombinase
VKRLDNPDYRYVDVAYNGPNNRNNVMDVRKVKPPEGVKDCYRTLFRFTDEFKSYSEINSSVKGYKGSAYADHFAFDIDDGENLDKSLQDARGILYRLENIFDVDVAEVCCFFSGAKGFHILIPQAMFGYHASDTLPQIFKIMAKDLAESIPYDGTIYEHVRLFRLSNTINSKTGLYKIPLSAREILHLSIDEIKEMAKSPRKIQIISASEIDQNVVLHEIYQAAIEKLNLKKPATFQPAKKYLLPKDTKLCYHNILEGLPEGDRDNASLRLANHFRKQGYGPDLTEGLMVAWNRRNNPCLSDNDLMRTIKQAYDNEYDFGCNDFLLQKFCDNRCYLKRKAMSEIDKSKIYSIDEAKAKYEEYIENLQRRKINIGIPSLDKSLRGIAPGEVMQIIARGGVGKTALLLNIIGNVNKQQKGNVLFFSLEMPVAQIYERAVQISGSYSGEEVETTFSTKSQNKEIMNMAAREHFDRVYFIDEDSITLDRMKDYIPIAEEKIRDRIDLICVDYLGRMDGGYGKEYEQISNLAKQLKSLAKSTDKAVICLHQTNREGGTGAEPITIDMGRGSGVIEEAADFVLGAWRPEKENPEYQKAEIEPLVLSILKGRKGPTGQKKLAFNKRKMTIKEYAPGEEPPDLKPKKRGKKQDVWGDIATERTDDKD